MTADLERFLAARTPLAEETAVWAMATLNVASYLDDQRPPLDYITSVRGIVFRDDSVLVLRNQDGLHILPGGRRENGERLVDTLRREVLEESGWGIGQVSQLGFMHFHHLTLMPPDYAYPYPDFLWLVCVAEAATFEPSARLADDYEIEAGFRSIAEAQALALSPGERLFLDAAMKLRSSLAL